MPSTKVSDAALKDAVIRDIFDHHRGFLPGEPCQSSDVQRHMLGSLRIDNVHEEERILALSVLPKTAVELWLSPLDKGLSGSSVYAARYSDRNDNYSKSFVMKVGPLEKIEREAESIVRYAAPYLPGIETPIVRRGLSMGLIVQELRGLTLSVQPQSLRLYVRNTDDGPEVIKRLLHDRLGSWYSSEAAPVECTFGELVADWLAKGPSGYSSALPSDWDDLTVWTEDLTGHSWATVGPTIADLVNSLAPTARTIIHGDLHSQNVLVDSVSRECWPIDFAWCRESSPLIDLAMLECSLMFLALPMRADLRAVLSLVALMAESPHVTMPPARLPYGLEIGRVINSVSSIRQYAVDQLHSTFEEYRKFLLLLMYSLITHPGLNRPLIIGATQVYSGVVSR